jgi:hypothetical protein
MIIQCSTVAQNRAPRGDKLPTKLPPNAEGPMLEPSCQRFGGQSIGKIDNGEMIFLSTYALSAVPTRRQLRALWNAGM